eukprot:PRCOL_00003444-RA
MAEESVTAAARPMREGGETHEFQAEVSRLMDIIINSLYSNKDIFLRELISNGSDAMDKIRFVALTDSDALGEGDAASLDVRIKIDKEKRMLSIRDKGVGMTKKHLVEHLGTIAKSGTAAFLDTMASGGDMSLIGQFGVGFYSVYLVADHVEVVTKHNDDAQYIWESKADGSFVITEDTENEPLGRGTDIRIYLKEEMLEYLEEEKITDLVKRYSEFINFPIYVWTSSESEVEVEIPQEELEEADEGDEGEAIATTRMEKVTTYDWERVNNNKAIWLRSPKDVEEEDYNEFYKSLTGDFQDPLAHTHFVAEGDVEFKAVLFVPKNAPADLLNANLEGEASLKLYVRRVFISDEFHELLPNYLKFIKGLVDSDSLPLNVSREMLQQHSSLKTIKKKLVRKALDMLRKMADEEMYVDEGEEEAEDDDSMTEFDDKSFQNASKEDMKMGSTDTETAGKIKELYKPLTKWWKDAVDSDELEAVKVSQRLTSSPLAVVTSKYGWSANMERIMKAQALGAGAEQQSYMKSKKTLEINPRHPLIIKMLEKVHEDSEDAALKTQAYLLYESALLESGFTPDDPKAFNARLLQSLQGAIGVESLEVDDDYEFPFPEEEEVVEEEEVAEEPAAADHSEL